MQLDGIHHITCITALHELAIDVDIHLEPFDLGDSPAFAQDTIHASYDADAVRRFWRILAGTEHALTQDSGNGSLAMLPYEAVRTATGPSATLLAFYQSADAGLAAARWDAETFDTRIR